MLIRRRGRSSGDQHLVEHLGRDGDLGGPGLVAVEAQPVTDDLLPARELALDTGPVDYSRCHAAKPSALCWTIAWMWPSRWVGSVSAVALSTASTRGGTTTVALWMALVQSAIHAGSVVAAVAQEELHRLGNLIQQRTYLGGIINIAVGQDGGDDPAAHRVEADVQLAPGTPLAGAVFLPPPLARAAQPQARTIDQQVDRSTGRAGLRRQFQALSPPAEGGVVGHRQVEAEQLEDRADQALGLTQRQVEHCAQRQGCGNRKVGVVGLTARRGAWRGVPSRDRFIRKPHGQTAPLTQRLVILRPIRHPSFRPRNMMAGGWRCICAA